MCSYRPCVGPNTAAVPGPHGPTGPRARAHEELPGCFVLLPADSGPGGRVFTEGRARAHRYPQEPEWALQNFGAPNSAPKYISPPGHPFWSSQKFIYIKCHFS